MNKILVILFNVFVNNFEYFDNKNELHKALNELDNI